GPNRETQTAITHLPVAPETDCWTVTKCIPTEPTRCTVIPTATVIPIGKTLQQVETHAVRTAIRMDWLTTGKCSISAISRSQAQTIPTGMVATMNAKRRAC